MRKRFGLFIGKSRRVSNHFLLGITSGIGFDPNFVFIERIYTENEGFIASFYGTIDVFRQYGHELEPGRAPDSYSRLRVKSVDLLDRALKCLHISANLKDLDRT